jgi:hypothetical protein
MNVNEQLELVNRNIEMIKEAQVQAYSSYAVGKVKAVDYIEVLRQLVDAKNKRDNLMEQIRLMKTDS